MRVGITGASGMLGSALISKLSNEHQVFATSRNKGFVKKGIHWECFDLTDLQNLNKWLVNTRPDMVVHCAAMVNVDDCENNMEFAKKLHVDSTNVIASYLNKNKKKLIYISTDSVFDGKKSEPYEELDQTNPLNTYAKTKLLGERSVLAMKKGLVLRTNIIGWSKSKNTSFAEWTLRGLVEGKPLPLFTDVIFSPLHVDDLSTIISKAINKKISGLYHCASRDYMSKYDFGVKMAEIFNLSVDNIEMVSIDDMHLKASRPKNMALCGEKLNLILEHKSFVISDAIKLMKNQYDKGF